MSYDHRFPVASSFGALDMRTAGTVFANVQNKHSAPGFCTISGDALLRLFRANGDRLHLDFARQVARTLPQYLSREGRTLADHGGFMRPGWINERVNTSDWLEPVGEIFVGSCWFNCSLLLTILDFPGIYAQPDSGLVACFDHVEAVWLPSSAASAPTLEIRNPTAFAAEMLVFIETYAATLHPLPHNCRENALHIEITTHGYMRHSLSSTPEHFDCGGA